MRTSSKRRDSAVVRVTLSVSRRVCSATVRSYALSDREEAEQSNHNQSFVCRSGEKMCAQFLPLAGGSVRYNEDFKAVLD